MDSLNNENSHVPEWFEEELNLEISKRVYNALDFEGNLYSLGQEKWTKGSDEWDFYDKLHAYLKDTYHDLRHQMEEDLEKVKIPPLPINFNTDEIVSEIMNMLDVSECEDGSIDKDFFEKEITGLLEKLKDE